MDRPVVGLGLHLDHDLDHTERLRLLLDSWLSLSLAISRSTRGPERRHATAVRSRRLISNGGLPPPSPLFTDHGSPGTRFLLCRAGERRSTQRVWPHSQCCFVDGRTPFQRGREDRTYPISTSSTFASLSVATAAKEPRVDADTGKLGHIQATTTRKIVHVIFLPEYRRLPLSFPPYFRSIFVRQTLTPTRELLHESII